MNKLIKNLTVAAAISIAIIGVYTPATASANGGVGREIQLDGGIKIPMEVIQRMIGNK